MYICHQIYKPIIFIQKISLFLFIAITLGLFIACSAEENVVKMNSSKDSSINLTSLSVGKLSLIDIPGIEIAFVPDFQKDFSFKEYYVFQYEKSSTTFLMLRQ